jgi:hypothetical protein
MNTNTITIERSTASRSVVDPVILAMNKAMSRLVLGINAVDKKLRERPGRIDAETANLLRLAEAYESTQPSYAADLRAAALAASRNQPEAS